MTRWTSEVRLERARLAIEDPLGELDAVQPLAYADAIRIIHELSDHLRDLPSRPARARGDGQLLIDALGLDRSRHFGIVRCPAHEDEQPSLSWKIVDHKLLLHCFAGCEFTEILEAVGVSV